MLPTLNKELIDTELEERMELVRNIVTLGRASREDAKIKVRQPLSEILLDKNLEEKVGDLVGLIKEELNIKEVVFTDNLSKYMDYQLKPDFKVAGRILGKHIKAFQQELTKLNPKEFVENLDKAPVNLQLNGEMVEIKKEYVEVRIQAKEGFDINMQDNVFVILDTALNEDLVKEGYMREFISKVQQLRKSNGFEVTDEIEIEYDSDNELDEALQMFKDEIMSETLAQKFTRANLDVERVELNDKTVGISLMVL